MAKRRQGEQRPFRPDVLDPFAGAHLLPRLLPGPRVWRYQVTVPIEQIKPTRQAKATPRDVNQLRRTFVRHFGGVTLLPSFAGYGLRDPDHPEQEPESNCNACFVVLALPPTGIFARYAPSCSIRSTRGGSSPSGTWPAFPQPSTPLSPHA